MYRIYPLLCRSIYRVARNSFYIRDRCNLEIERVFSADLGCEISGPKIVKENTKQQRRERFCSNLMYYLHKSKKRKRERMFMANTVTIFNYKTIVK